MDVVETTEDDGSPLIDDVVVEVVVEVEVATVVVVFSPDRVIFENGRILRLNLRGVLLSKTKSCA